MVVAALGLLAGQCSAPEDVEVHLNDGVVGTWNIRWDRSGTGWSPPHFHGTLIVADDGEIGLEWFESTGVPLVTSVMQGSRDTLTIELAREGKPQSSTTMEIKADGDSLRGHMRSGDGEREVPWSPLYGTRVPTLRHAER